MRLRGSEIDLTAVPPTSEGLLELVGLCKFGVQLEGGVAEPETRHKSTTTESHMSVLSIIARRKVTAGRLHIRVM